MQSKVLHPYLYRFTVATSLIAIVVSIAVTMGWIFDIATLKSINPDWASMKFNTAFCFFFIGLSLFLQPYNKKLSMTFAAIVASFGFVNLFQYIFNINLGIDELIFRDPITSITSSYPGRMSFATALMFTFQGLAILIQDFEIKNRFRPSQALVLISAFMSLLAIVGYLFGEQPLDKFTQTTSVAIHAAITFFLLSFGILFLRPDKGIMRNFTVENLNTTLSIRLTVFVVLTPIIFGWLSYMGLEIGLYNSQYSIVIMIVLTSAFLGAVAWWNLGELNTASLKIRKTEEALRLYNDELETTVNERTQELNRQSEINANLSKNIAISEMSKGVAHEINTPLAIICIKSAQIEELIGQNKIAEVFQSAKDIERTAFKIANIIKAMRMIAKDTNIEDAEVVSIKTIISNVLLLCGEKFKSRGIIIHVAELPDHIKIKCSVANISQVILNLLYNSYDAVENLKDKWVKIEVAETEDSIHISVIDSGKGIKKEIQEKMMQPFFTTKDIGKGMGLGLSTLKGIVESHQGEFKFDPTSPNTRFVVTLPRYKFVNKIKAA